MTIEQVIEQVSEVVTDGSPVAARPSVRADTGGLTIEFEDPYPEVPRAFDAYRRVAERGGELVWYRVKAVEGGARARVSVRVEGIDGAGRGDAVADDVVTAAVVAFDAAFAQVA